MNTMTCSYEELSDMEIFQSNVRHNIHHFSYETKSFAKHNLLFDTKVKKEDACLFICLTLFNTVGVKFCKSSLTYMSQPIIAGCRRVLYSIVDCYYNNTMSHKSAQIIDTNCMPNVKNTTKRFYNIQNVKFKLSTINKTREFSTGILQIQMDNERFIRSLEFSVIPQWLSNKICGIMGFDYIHSLSKYIAIQFESLAATFQSYTLQLM
ncbi:DgyrCDS14488 [Dimorphilus gyrociliatus]|uniref:DgyrCDS14488 n=1 Tax=Dimorphilus gyrociliatus TaxID=2664684 RepID=A0A7I8WDZ3_9ANNE|nr:DgyrCDS14488 [Dimorphilus gyrociliatus]